MTLTSLLGGLVSCSSGCSSTATTIVIRDTSGFSVGPTARDSMLKPRRENRPDTLASTPGTFSTRTLRVWWVMDVRAPSGRRYSMSDPLSDPLSDPFDLFGPFDPRGSLRHLGVVGQRPNVPCGHDFVVAGSRRHHRPDLCVLTDDEIDHDGTVVD